jgi:hypothetical protein
MLLICCADGVRYKQDAGNNCYERSDKIMKKNNVEGVQSNNPFSGPSTTISAWFWVFWIFDRCQLVVLPGYSDHSMSNDAPASPGCIHVSGRTIRLNLFSTM